MKKIISIILVAGFISFSIPTVSAAGKNYFQLYKLYKHRYENAKKELKKVKKQRDKYGSQNEGTYLELVQCQRQLLGVNPWLDEQK